MSSEKKQIYIVDDDESVRRALKLLMLTYGFAVDVFATSEEFFKAVPNSAPGCLILDIHMPGLDGWATLQRLFLSGSERRVIMISANKSGANKEKAFKAGAVGFLQKPFKDQELVDLINEEWSK